LMSYKSDIGARDLTVFLYRGVKLYMVWEGQN